MRSIKGLKSSVGDEGTYSLVYLLGVKVGGGLESYPSVFQEQG